jgi:hypothetical protein
VKFQAVDQVINVVIHKSILTAKSNFNFSNE